MRSMNKYGGNSSLGEISGKGVDLRAVKPEGGEVVNNVKNANTDTITGQSRLAPTGALISPPRACGDTTTIYAAIYYLGLICAIFRRGGQAERWGAI